MIFTWQLVIVELLIGGQFCLLALGYKKLQGQLSRDIRPVFTSWLDAARGSFATIMSLEKEQSVNII